MVMRWVSGADTECDARLKRIFGADLAAGADRLEKILRDLGVGTRPEDHGVEVGEWRELVKDALGGERGKNFLGDAKSVLARL
jgi:alcohol dehydrogenase